VRFPFEEAGGRAEGTVIVTGVAFGLRRKVRIETVAAQFEIDETDVQLVSRSSSGQA
jgi:predicted RNA-binding protein with TRAM domain